VIQKLTEAALQDDYLFDPKDPESIKQRLINFMVYVVGKDPAYASRRDWFFAVASLVRGILSERYINNARAQFDREVKRIYYLSLEYLPGRGLMKHLLDLGMVEPFRKVLEDCGQDLDLLADCETDPGLGNGGLGRLAACYLDALATHGYPGLGYGLRYDFGMFRQRIEKGQQIESPEHWLRYGNPWEFPRPSILYPVRFGGRIERVKGSDGEEHSVWLATEDVLAMAFDVPISGYGGRTVTNLRLWAARSTRDFDLRYFNEGNYIEAVKDKTLSENLTRVLYPSDRTLSGQELRLKQEYFFVAASLQDILVRFRRYRESLDALPDKVAIQLNDTHPALVVPELMRILVDEENFEWERAWELTNRTVSYTNHTLMPEALETWPVPMLQALLPRHLEIILQINSRFLERVKNAFPGEPDARSRLSLVDDTNQRVRMAHLAFVGSHKVNGVAQLHAQLMRSTTFADLDRMFPDRIMGITNGITPRRWLLQANPGLAALVTEAVGPGWITDLGQIAGLAPLASDPAFLDRFEQVKRERKEYLTGRIRDRHGTELDPDSLFDVQVKRIHEYKRQLLNVLHVISRYNRIREGRLADPVPRTVILAGKAAPGYFMAKLIIRLIHDVGEVINADPKVRPFLRLHFIPDYNVTAAERIIPAGDLSEQISTAGMEASGTGNMKFALNGALTIGTLDGANIEIREAVGEENFFLFGLTADQVRELRGQTYNPRTYVEAEPDLKQALEQIRNGWFSSDEPDRYKGITEALLEHGDYFLLCADFAAYRDAQDRVDQAWRDRPRWLGMAVRNVAAMGPFSGDRAVHQYARDIWGIAPLK
jgi:starch phosphorylase